MAKHFVTDTQTLAIGAQKDLRTFPVRVEGDKIFVEI